MVSPNNGGGERRPAIHIWIDMRSTVRVDWIQKRNTSCILAKRVNECVKEWGDADVLLELG